MSEGRARAGGAAVSERRSVPDAWRTAGGAIDLQNPVLMGILNVTPDSFSDGGRYLARDAALEHAHRLAEDGADILDVGGESTRPGADPVPEAEELRRVLPVIEALVGQVDVPISIDTTKAAVARAALAAGAAIVNDISGLRFEPELGAIAAEHGAGLVLMHIRGEPRTMQREIHYDDLLGEIEAELRESVERARAAGCEDSQLVIDPGIGFAKRREHNLILINHLDRLGALGLPVLVGPSRKSFIGSALETSTEERLEGTLAACVVALERGARIFRVHDVGAARRALDMAAAILGS